MPEILLPRRHYTQPQGRVEVAPEWSNAVLSAAVGGSLTNIITGPESAASVAPGSIQVGSCDVPSGAAPSVIERATPGTEFLILCVFSPDTLSGAKQLFAYDSFSSPVERVVQFRTNNADLQMIRFNTGTGTPSVSRALGVASGGIASVVGWSNGSDFGVISPSGESASTIIDTPTSWGVNSMAETNSLSRWFLRRNGASGTFEVGLHKHALRAVLRDPGNQEARRSLQRNPWQIFRADPIRIYSLPASGDVTGTIAAVETGSDIAALVGNVAVSGTIAANEAGADVSALAGGVLVTGSISAQEAGSDIAAFAGETSDTVFGTLAATEQGQDAAAMSGAVLVSGAISAQESSADTAALTGAVLIDGSLAANEAGSDTASFEGTAAGPITGSMDAVESGSDTAAFSGPIADAVAPSGGSAVPSTRYKTREERDEERRRLGIIPAAPVAVVEAVKAIAVKESAKPVTPSPAKLEAQLRTDLAQAKEAYRAEYLQALIAQVELQRLQEIDRQLQEEEDEAIAMLMMALAA